MRVVEGFLRPVLFSLCGLVLLAMAPHAHVEAAPKADVDEDAPLFFPGPPAPPRLQFLAKFSSAYDINAESSKFRNFVFGGEEHEEQVLTKPFGAAVFEGAIYATDSRGDGYVVFDIAAGKWREVKGSGAGALKKAINITIDKDGTRYITDTIRNQVIVFDRNDRFLRAIGEVGQFRPVDVAILGDRLYISDSENQKIHVLNKLTGETQFSFGGSGDDAGEMVHPTNLAVGPDGSIYVSDTTNFRVQQFTPEGEFVRAIGSVGTSIGKFARPKGVAVDKEGRLYVVDAAFQNVQIFDDKGRVLLYFGSASNEKGGFNLPTVVKIDYDSVEYFKKYAAPGFEIEYIVVVVNQFGPNKVSVFGFGARTD